MTADWRLAVDIGGTFTDVVLVDASSGDVIVDKTLTTPSNPLDGVRTGVGNLLARAGVRPADVTAPIVHATTLITNALIEGKTGRAGLVTTAGFGDTLLIRDEHRYDMYDLQIEFPPPPIPRGRTVEIVERTNASGHVFVEPSPEQLAAITEQLRSMDVESVGVCLLNAYVNATNERTIADHLERELGVPVCISADVSPQIREYRRMVTTACNAATMCRCAGLRVEGGRNACGDDHEERPGVGLLRRWCSLRGRWCRYRHAGGGDQRAARRPCRSLKVYGRRR